MSRISASTVAYRRAGSLCIAVRHNTSRSAHSDLPRCAPGNVGVVQLLSSGNGRALGLLSGDQRFDIARFSLALERQAPGDQFIENDAQCVDVRIDPDAAAA